MNKNYIFLTLVALIIVAGLYVFIKHGQKTTDVLNNEGGVTLQNEVPQPTSVTTNTGTEGKQDTTTPLTTNSKKYMNNSDVKTLDIQVTAQGTGTAVSKKGDTLSMNYTGKLLNGTVFDSNVDPKFQHMEPFTFPLGAGRVIQGWDIGLLNMKVGEKRTLTIPAELAYGPMSPSPLIPPHSALVFDVELLNITPGK